MAGGRVSPGTGSSVADGVVPARRVGAAVGALGAATVAIDQRFLTLGLRPDGRSRMGANAAKHQDGVRKLHRGGQRRDVGLSREASDRAPVDGAAAGTLDAGRLPRHQQAVCVAPWREPQGRALADPHWPWHLALALPTCFRPCLTGPPPFWRHPGSRRHRWLARHSATCQGWNGCLPTRTQ